MSVIILDYTKVDTDIADQLGSAPHKKGGYVPGLVLVLTDIVYKALSTLPKGKDRIDYVNSKTFRDGILFHCYIMYNPVKDVCLIGGECISGSHTKGIMNALEKSFTNNTKLWVAIPSQEEKLFDTVTQLGFTNPYLTSKTPSNTKIPISMAFTRNAGGTVHPPRFVLRKAKHILHHYKSGSCQCKMSARFSKKAIDLLRTAPKTMGMVGKTQREITGELYPKDIIVKNGKYIYVFDVHDHSIESGEEENVDVPVSRYNFHTHPEEAYVRHSVKNAWPSVTDYLGYRTLGKNTIFHVVATLEGVYILSFTPHWADKVNKIPERFIDENYEIDHKEPYTPEEYTKKINSILYKGKPIYKVQYIPWKKITDTFSVHYSKMGEGCMPTQEIIDSYDSLHEN
jgi:hypothetical protein